mmetsp:Transcript_26586/g.53363  ORF Transcript_26586/g.53363 Transcript_26586/m.53363 type:complete len:81 (-) Transcript_26586:139-381(-)|eukprot:CAMPEP_0196718846 /NCGR_PEP_ID=MMETSP1091-20130531/1931_1 /TAXON_ID=302021 /ORGANISM="Rhodomonas sp., Strain CCMP768" /LENGTH=80 /DNA_ID=CAMNT_0042059597 /DNA_START=235 /DNA_END=477 /DNA_ORIENTATION=-
MSGEGAGCFSCFGVGKKKEEAAANAGNANGAAAKSDKPRRLSQAEQAQQDLIKMYEEGRQAGTIVDARAASSAARPGGSV